jgi:ribonuclease P protein component
MAPRYTLDKSMKMRCRTHFEHLKRNGRSLVGKALVVVFLPSESTVCGVICSKKYSLLAVDRNRARRLLWESFRLLQPHLQSKCTMLLIARHRLKTYSRQQTTREIAHLLADAGIVEKSVAASPPES